MSSIPVFGEEISIPRTCGGLSFSDFKFYGKADLGISFRYYGPLSIHADAYLYNLRITDISNDLKSPKIIKLFQNECHNVFMAADTGMYLDLEMIDCQTIYLSPDSPNPFCLWASFSYSQAQGSGVFFTGRQISHISLRIDRGFINKVRYSYPDCEEMEQKGFNCFMDFWVEWTSEVQKCGTQNRKLPIKRALPEVGNKDGVVVGEKKKEAEKNQKSKKDQEYYHKSNYQQIFLSLSDMLESMKNNPKYKDVEEVVSQKHFDEMITALSMYHISQTGGDVQEIAHKIEREIWMLPNPYEYMYELIKKYHPEYTGQWADNETTTDKEE